MATQDQSNPNTANQGTHCKWRRNLHCRSYLLFLHSAITNTCESPAHFDYIVTTNLFATAGQNTPLTPRLPNSWQKNSGPKPLLGKRPRPSSLDTQSRVSQISWFSRLMQDDKHMLPLVCQHRQTYVIIYLLMLACADICCHMPACTAFLA